jgi:cysteine-S-conjugate beta-lyase
VAIDRIDAGGSLRSRLVGDRATATPEPALARLQRRRSAKWSHHPDDVLPAWVAEMDFPLAEPVRQALAEAVELGDTGYADPEAAGLATAFAGFMRRRLGWEVDPGGVIAVRDVVDGLGELVEVLTEPGEGVVINPPVYYPFFTLVRERRRRLVEVPLLGGRELDVEGVETAFAAGARVLILCNPHNPTGAVAEREALAAIAAAAARHGAWVLADEVHAPLTLPGAEFVPFLGIGEEARARGVAVTSASKAFNLAGLGCAQIATASEEAATAVGRLPSLARHPGHLGVLAAVAAFSEPAAAVWLDEVIATLDTNRRLLGELLGERLPEIGYRPPSAGYLAWLDLSELGLGPDPAPILLERGRVALSSGPRFGIGGEGRARLNIGTSPQLVHEAVERIATAVGR